MSIYRWLIIVAIGTLTAMTGCFITILIDLLTRLKFSVLKFYVDKCTDKDCMFIPYILWIIFNVVSVLIGSLLVTYIAPVAAGSGIPVIKCYLNGVKIPEVVRIKTLIVKAVGVILSVVGGLAVGKEGPMIHCGSVIAAGISQGKSTTFRKDFKVFERFREDHEKRDFVSAGAAAGVATAFGAPIGGVLFSLEEGASFWNQYLTWRIFVFLSSVQHFALGPLLAAHNGVAGWVSFQNLVNFLQDINYDVFELPIYMLMGALGGLLGALYNHINSKLAVYRMKYLHHKYSRVLESAVVAIMSATVGFLMIYFSNDCQEYGENIENYTIQYHCPDGEFSTLGALWFQTPEASVRSMFHNLPGTWSISSLAIFIVFYYMLGCWTYGLSISSGLFIPTLLIGATWGRLIAKIIIAISPNQPWINFSKFALIGAAAMLGGVVRMTISLTAILIESTGNLTLGLPLMLTLMIAKWVGDYFNEVFWINLYE
ncbi:H(+)/Cl(-) exchange transporter 7-like, partial [Centruroides sculpturatus]|uniref:H(+)/Cl(-) exchange transporter 7-like n=1 Tax=Centruroides sculpturatus TaxID=218467 RepID=UPI000C6D1041